MATIFTARLRVRDWRALLRLSDETLLLYARAAGARRYQLFRDTHDAAEALLLVEAASAAALHPVSDALFHLDTATLGRIVAGKRAEPSLGRLWEPTGCRVVEAAAKGAEDGPPWGWYAQRAGRGASTDRTIDGANTREDKGENHE